MASALLRYRTYVVFLSAALFVLALRFAPDDTLELPRPAVLTAAAPAFAGTRLRVTQGGAGIAVPNVILAAAVSSLAAPRPP